MRIFISIFIACLNTALTPEEEKKDERSFLLHRKRRRWRAGQVSFEERDLTSYSKVTVIITDENILLQCVEILSPGGALVAAQDGKDD